VLAQNKNDALMEVELQKAIAEITNLKRQNRLLREDLNRAKEAKFK
jgi:hypothetical protein